LSYTHQNQVDLSPGIIDFGRGHPSPDLLPLTLLQSAAERRFAEDHVAFLQYGSEQGDSRFRGALAEFLSLHYGEAVDPATLLITSGASSALQLICTFFTKPGDTVFVEEPSYFLALRIFADHRLKVVGLPIDDEGLQIESLEAHLKKVRPSFLYTIPTFQNPTGTTMSAKRRAQLLALSRRHNLLIVADEVYHLLSYASPPPPPLGNHVASARLISLGSFSKILAPGLRLGWLQTGRPLIERFVKSGLLQSGGGLNPFTSALVSNALELGLQDQHLEKLKRVYRNRSQSLNKALLDHMGKGTNVRKADGGYFMWLELTHTINAERLLHRALLAGVRFQPGERFSTKGNFQNFIRLSFSYHAVDEIEQGVSRLNLLLKS
jgi:2-aminoadipate transaminase